jgi:hypothetical protein
MLRIEEQPDEVPGIRVALTAEKSPDFSAT